MGLNFFKEYMSNPKTVGAILPSSKKLAEKIMDNIDFEKAHCIVEYGPGTGVFTDELIIRRKRGAILVLVEYNKDFYDHLKIRYKNVENLIILNESAENIDVCLGKYNIKNVDYIVSGLPFASLEKSMANKIMEKSKYILGEQGEFIAFQYTLLKKGFIEEYFRLINIDKVNLNVPPAYVFRCNSVS